MMNREVIPLACQFESFRGEKIMAEFDGIT